MNEFVLKNLLSAKARTVLLLINKNTCYKNLYSLYL